jgi:rhodanese-related sulfurtransferase
MPTTVAREEVQRLVRDASAQLVEVLPRPEYEDEHIAGAKNMPLKQLDRESARALDPGEPVIVYCHDLQ